MQHIPKPSPPKKELKLLCSLNISTLKSILSLNIHIWHAIPHYETIHVLDCLAQGVESVKETSRGSARSRGNAQSVTSYLIFK